MARILVVDDIEDIRVLLELLLVDAGHEVTIVENGMSALDFAHQKSVDLVITDLNMPMIGGPALIRQLRSLDNYSATPILVLTAENSNDIKSIIKNSGANGWIHKPLDPDQLYIAVNKLLAKRSS